MNIKDGKSLNSLLKTIVRESYKTLQTKRKILREEELNAPEEEGEETPESGGETSSDKDHNALKSGDIDSQTIIEKLNTIRAGKSFKDSSIKAEMEEYLNELSKEEKTALFAFLKAISQIVTGEVDAENVVDPGEPPADLSIQKGGEKSVTISKIRVVSTKSDGKSAKSSSKEDTTGPTPIKPK
jgi:hypothetical protein